MPNARFTDALSTNFALQIIIITIQRNTCIWQSWLHLWFAFLKPIVSQFANYVLSEFVRRSCGF